MHASGVRHAGHHITSGTRWVMVLFVRSRQVPQLAWRCAANPNPNPNRNPTPNNNPTPNQVLLPGPSGPEDEAP